MWRSKARDLLLLRSLPTRFSLRTQVPLQTLTLTRIPLSRSLPSRWSQNPRFFSAEEAPNPSPFESIADPKEVEIDENADSNDAQAWNFVASEESPIKFEDGIGETPVWDLDAAAEVGADKGDSFGEFGEESADSSLLEGDGAEIKAAEVDSEQVENVISLLGGDSGDPVESSLDKLELNLSEEFVIKVIQGSDNVGDNLIRFFKWALECDESVKTSAAIGLLVKSVKGFPELKKEQAYMLWDLLKELGKEKWVLSTEIVNDMISMFWRLGKAKAGLEVFNKFDEFGCAPDADSYYYTIGALGKRSMFDTAWSVCEKMLDSGSLPDKEKIGEIITFFCKGKKAKEAHVVYLMAKEKNLIPGTSSLNFLICGLTRFDETVPLALELLEYYPRDSFKHANKTFGAVVKGLCKVKKPQEAKSLLLSMVESGPAPGNAAFNYVITALCKGGEVEDAVALLKVMEGRGLRPDVYTYTVVMSGYAKGGMMDEANKIFCEAKKRHDKLSPATFHVLIRGYCKMEEFDKALECMQGMKEHGVKPNADEYNKMIESLCLKALDWRAAEKLFEEMKESGVYLKGVTCSLITAVRELEEEEAPPEVASIAA